MNTQEQYTVELLKKMGGVFDAYRVTTYRCYRKAKDGSEQEFTVRVLDAGADVPAVRYAVVVTTSDGKSICSPSADTIDQGPRPDPQVGY